MPAATRRIPLTQAALRLGLTYHQARDRLLRGDLRGGQDEFGHYYIDEQELNRLKNRSRPARGRRGQRS